MTDETHGAALKSWVASANGHADFPIQNLPFGVFSPADGTERGGVAIGDSILDLSAALAEGLLSGEAADAAQAASATTLNAFMGLGAGPRQTLRQALSALLREDGAEAGRAKALGERLLHDAGDCVLHLPAAIGDYTDFYAGINHATNAGSLFRPDTPLLPNYKHVPVAYHSRASSIRASGHPVKRPSGQTRAPDAPAPVFGPTRRLDIELELGVWVGPGNALGEPVPIAKAAEHIAGYCLLNDWSARDVQAWEYQPLGPFLGKNFLSTISPWVITPEALAPFRIAQPRRPDGDPRPLPYLLDDKDQAEGAMNLRLDVLFSSAAMRGRGMAPMRLSMSNTSYLYWTPAQMLAHHTCGGCNLQPGDLYGTGTISGPTARTYGSLLEMSSAGKHPFSLPTGETRAFLEDGDEVIFAARAERQGFASIGFGECRGLIAG